MHPFRAFIALNLALLIPAGCGGTPEPEPRASLAAPSDPSFILPGRILFQSNADGDNEIFILTRDGVRQLTDNDWEDEYPVWSPDGGRIAFASDRNGSYDIFVMAADGTGALAVTGTDQDEREPDVGVAHEPGDAERCQGDLQLGRGAGIGIRGGCRLHPG